MKNTFDINKYIQLKKDVKQHYQDIKLGEQNLYENQSNLFKPLSDIATAQSKEIQDKIISNQDAFHNAIVPFTSNIEKRIEQLENLQSLPYYQIEEPEPKVTPSAPRIVQLNFDEDFTDADKIDDSDGKIKATIMGKRVAELYIDPLTANFICRARKNADIFMYNLDSGKRWLVSYRDGINSGSEFLPSSNELLHFCLP